jgi:hypothetical protein
MKLWILSALVAFSLVFNSHALAPIGEIPTEEDCLGYIAILPTFHSEKMKVFYEMNPKASGKELVEKIQSLANTGDKDLLYTYSQLLLNGYCVPKDVCAARWYLEKSRGGPNNWEQVYPIQPWPKDTDSMCNENRSYPIK